MTGNTWSSTDIYAIERNYRELTSAGHSVELVVTLQDAERFRTWNLKVATNQLYAEQRAASPMKKVAMILSW